MPKLDELRACFRACATLARAPGSDIEDATYAIVDVNGMKPSGQFDALSEAAREMGWNVASVACEGGMFVIMDGVNCYRLPCLSEDNNTKVIIPYFTPDVAERIRDKFETISGSVISDFDQQEECKR